LDFWLAKLLLVSHLLVTADDLFYELVRGIECPNSTDNLSTAPACGKGELFVISPPLEPVSSLRVPHSFFSSPPPEHQAAMARPAVNSLD
jgi:hypothetical protein